MEMPSAANRIWPTTHWSLVGRAGHGGEVERRQALTVLIKQYFPVLRKHLLVRRRLNRGEVDDILHEFLISKILEQEIIQRAQAERGRFRSFLATALDRFIKNHVRAENAQKRKPAGDTLSIDLSPEPVDHAPMPEDTFNIAWSRQILGRAVRRMRRDCASDGRPDIWGVFKGRILKSTLGGGNPQPYGELVTRYRFVSPAQASNVLTTANRMFARILRNLVSTYEMGEAEIDQEILDLWHAASRSRAGNR